MNVIETLQQEHSELTTKLAELDERIKNERPALVSQIAQITKAIAVLTKPATTPGERKPMSEAGRAAIKAGLEKARAAKLSRGVAELSKPAPSVTVAVSGTDPAKKTIAADKGTSRGL